MEASKCHPLAGAAVPMLGACHKVALRYPTLQWLEKLMGGGVLG